MKRGQHNRGYTILELLIVIAVSAAMFFTAIIAFNGRQQEVQFTQAVRDFDSRLIDLTNDVSTGFFNNDGNQACTVISDVIQFVGSPDEQGSNDDCVFIGKVLQFRPGSGPPGEYDEMNVITVVGKRKATSGELSNSLVDSAPKAAPNSVETIALDWGLRVTKVFVTDSSGANTNIGAVGLFTAFTTFAAEENAVISNNQQVRHMGIAGSTFGMTADDSGVFTPIANIASEPNGDAVTICLQKADQTKRAAIVIGKDGTRGTTVQFDGYDSECETDA